MKDETAKCSSSFIPPPSSFITMPFSWRKRKRFERVASLELPPGQWERAWIGLRRRDVMGRIGLALLAAMATCAVIHGWDPPFPYRTGYSPPRNIDATVPFTKADPAATAVAQQRARDQTRYVYAQDAEPLVQLRAKLRNTLVELTAAATLDKLDPKLWKAFQPPLAEGAKPLGNTQQEEQFGQFRAAFTPQQRLDGVDKALAAAFEPFEMRGLLVLDKLNQDKDKLGGGNQDEITIYHVGHPDQQETVRVSDVLIGDGNAIRDSLRQQADLAPVADRLFAWLLPRLKPTLTMDDRLTKDAMDQAAQAVPEVLESYSVGQKLASAGQPLEYPQLDLLRREYAAAMAQRPKILLLNRTVAVTGMIFVAFLLCGMYMRYHQRGPLTSLTRLILLLLLAIASVAAAVWASSNAWRGELVPVLLFGMTMAIVHQQRLAMLLASMMAIIVVLAIGHGLPEYLLLTGVTAAAVLNLGQIRSRSKLIYVGLFAGAVGVVLYVAMAMIDDQPLCLALLKDAMRNGLWALAAGFIITGSLPFIEHLFGVLTDLSLLELGDVAHPLLQELVRRRRARTTTRSRWARSPKRRPRASTPGDSWSAWGPISTTSARCSSRAILWRTRGPTITTGTRRSCPP